MASSVASLPRPEPQPSPSASFQTTTTPLDNLISYLVASKRSLSSISHVHRATDIIAEAHEALESMTILVARTNYLQRSIASQLKTLRGVQFELEEVASNVQSDFQRTLIDLDASHKKLADTVDILQATKVEDGFKSKPDGGDQGQDAPDSKETLHDFVDDEPVEDLKNELRAAIDEVTEAQRGMDRSIKSFEDELQAVNSAVDEKTLSSSSTRSDLQQTNIPTSLRTMESHAREMAEGLESLVKHFDLCVTAIKHTEGGGAAMAQNVSVGELPEGVGVEKFDAPTRPITDDEKSEMLQVLENDATEVDDVVIEIQDRHGDMEHQLGQVLMYKQHKETLYAEVVAAFKLLEQISSRLTGYMTQSSTYVAVWEQQRAKIEDGMTNLNELQEVYENFLQAYDGLIVEVARRKAVKGQMEKIAFDAQSKLEKLYEKDLAEREAFRTEQGVHLPSDIWPKISSRPPKFVISQVNEEEGSIPSLPRKKVEEALMRLQRQRRRLS